MKIYLIRHGETDANKNAIIQGRTDNPLNQTGINQARQTGNYLKNLNIDFDYCISSTLSRAVDTAAIIKKQLNLDLETHLDSRIVERDFGSYEGKKIEAGYFQAVHEGRIYGMETDKEIETRVLSFFKDFCMNHKHKNVLMLAHSHVIKALLITHIPTFKYDTYLTNCSINILECSDAVKIIDYNMDPLKE